MENEVKMELALWDKKFRLADIMSNLMPRSGYDPHPVYN
jgi:hypothetical protein